MLYVLTFTDPANVTTGDLAWLAKVIGDGVTPDEEAWDRAYVLVTEEVASLTLAPVGALREVEIEYRSDGFRVRAGMNVLETHAHD